MDDNTWKKEADWNRDCSTGQKTLRNEIVDKPFTDCFFLDWILFRATGAAYSLYII